MWMKRTKINNEWKLQLYFFHLLLETSQLIYQTIRLQNLFLRISLFIFRRCKNSNPFDYIFDDYQSKNTINSIHSWTRVRQIIRFPPENSLARTSCIPLACDLSEKRGKNYFFFFFFLIEKEKRRGYFANEIFGNRP